LLLLWWSLLFTIVLCVLWFLLLKNCECWSAFHICEKATGGSAQGHSALSFAFWFGRFAQCCQHHRLCSEKQTWVWSRMSAVFGFFHTANVDPTTATECQSNEIGPALSFSLSFFDDNDNAVLSTNFYEGIRRGASRRTPIMERKRPVSGKIHYQQFFRNSEVMM